MLRETELFLRSVLLDDASVLDLLRADYTYLNERLAKHYGVDGVFGDAFRRVTLQDPNRRGLLGRAASCSRRRSRPARRRCSAASGS